MTRIEINGGHQHPEQAEEDAWDVRQAL